jgi:hypothetical protein
MLKLLLGVFLGLFLMIMLMFIYASLVVAKKCDDIELKK